MGAVRRKLIPLGQDICLEENEVSGFVKLREEVKDKRGKNDFENSVATCSMAAENDDDIDFGVSTLLVPPNAILDDAGFIFPDPSTNPGGNHLIRFLIQTDVRLPKLMLNGAMKNQLLKIRLMKSPIRQTLQFPLMKFPIKNGKQTQHHENPCSPHHCKGSCLFPPNPAWYKGNPYQAGLTLIELIIVIAIIATLAGIALPSYSAYVDRARVAIAIQDIRAIQYEIIAYNIDSGYLPTDLSDINMDSRLDPWGNPYQYTNFDLAPKGKWRKDKFLVPINSTFDLWSMGPDGKSVPPLTAKSSQDDIIRANDGNFIGKARLY